MVGLVISGTNKEDRMEDRIRELLLEAEKKRRCRVSEGFILRELLADLRELVESKPNKKYTTDASKDGE